MIKVVRKTLHLSIHILLATLVVSCITTGDSNLTEEAAAKIIEGESSKADIAGLLGAPGQILYLDRESLKNYINRVYPGEPPEVQLPEGHYEVWTYSRWNQAAVLILFPTYEKATACMLIINSDGVCVKKLYVEKNRLEY